MKFTIATTEYFKSLGYDTSNWRKSVDGTQAVVHHEFAEVLCDEDKIDVYQHDDKAFIALMESEVWTEMEEEGS